MTGSAVVAEPAEGETEEQGEQKDLQDVTFGEGADEGLGDEV